MDIADTTPRRFRLPPPRVELRHTGDSQLGMGVYALERYEPGAVIEVCPVLLFRRDFEALPTAFKFNVFDWQDLTATPHTHALALGYGSMYNGANPANVRYRALRIHRNPLIEFSAARLIQPGEQLTINYSGRAGAPESPDNGWFIRHGIKMVQIG